MPKINVGNVIGPKGDTGNPGIDGESYVDSVRRTGAFGVLPTDTDAQVLNKINNTALSYKNAAESAAQLAQTSATIAEALVGPVYTNDEDTWPTEEGASFVVDNGDGTVSVWNITNGNPVERINMLSTTYAASDAGASAIGYKYPHANSVKRTLASKANDTIHVKDFGAVCDGVTDDTAAIQKAVNAAKDRTLLFSGNCIITSPIAVSALGTVNFKGEGGATITLVSTTPNIAAFEFFSSSGSQTTLRDGFFKELTIHAMNGENQNGFRYYNSTSSSIGLSYSFEDVTVRATGYSFDFYNTTYIGNMHFLRVESRGGGGIRFSGIAGTSYHPHSTSALRIDNFHFSGANKIGPALHLEGCRNTYLTNVVLEGSCVVHSSLTGAADFPVFMYLKNVMNMSFRGVWCEVGGIWPTQTDGSKCFHTQIESSIQVQSPIIFESISGAFSYNKWNIKGGATVPTTITILNSSVSGDNIPETIIEGETVLKFVNCDIKHTTMIINKFSSLSKVFFHNCTFTIDGASGWNGNAGVLKDLRAPIEVYKYQGGFLSNKYAKCKPTSTYENRDKMAQPLYNPVDGHTMLFTNVSGTSAVPSNWHTLLDNTLPAIDFSKHIGEIICVRMKVRFPYLQKMMRFRYLIDGAKGIASGNDAYVEDRDKWLEIAAFKKIDGTESAKFFTFHNNMFGYGYGGTDKYGNTIDTTARPLAVEIKDFQCTIGNEHLYTAKIENAECYDEDRGIPTDRGTWAIGDRVLKQTLVAGSPMSWICVASGTNRTISFTGNVEAGSPTITNVSKLCGAFVGEFLAYDSKIYRVINYTDDTITVDKNFVTAGTGVSFANSPASFKTFETLPAL